MCDDELDEDVDYGYQDKNGEFTDFVEDEGVDFEEEQKAELRGNR